MATSMLNPTAPVWTPDRPSQHCDSNSTSPMTPPTPLSFSATAFVPQQVQQHFHPVNGYYPYMPYYNGYNMAYPLDTHGYTQKGYAEYSANEHYVGQEHPHHAYAPYQGHYNITEGLPSNEGGTGAQQFQAEAPFGDQFHLFNNHRAAADVLRHGFNGWYVNNHPAAIDVSRHGFNGWYVNNHGAAIDALCHGFNGWHTSNSNGNGNGNAGAGVDANGGETKTKQNNKKKNKKKKAKKNRKDSKQDTDGDDTNAASGQDQGDAGTDSDYQLICVPDGANIVEVE